MGRKDCRLRLFFFEGRRVRVAGRERVAVGLEGGLVRVALPRLFIKGGECVWLVVSVLQLA